MTPCYVQVIGTSLRLMAHLFVQGATCPSCTARRMDASAAALVDRVLPCALYRQWVLTVPWRIRLRLAADKHLLSRALSALLRTLFAWQRRRARRAGLAKPLCRAVSFVARRTVEPTATPKPGDVALNCGACGRSCPEVSKPKPGRHR